MERRCPLCALNGLCVRLAIVQYCKTESGKRIEGSAMAEKGIFLGYDQKQKTCTLGSTNAWLEAA
jgi:hypothetical protein